MRNSIRLWTYNENDHDCKKVQQFENQLKAIDQRIGKIQHLTNNTQHGQQLFSEQKIQNWICLLYTSPSPRDRG